ncbi:PQQ-dependent sugar dehydrogenase [Planctomonas psychrotolerans]|uniref:PQQ-dependent sugar dehydrogenase n=1 Tax=Planctomonas psychrotolerans TaxID=2528712 RepID=UPI00123B328F|nr:PQQ-dependent sugar dehydrogenase [Planctomonas psychrotolerans]
MLRRIFAFPLLIIGALVVALVVSGCSPQEQPPAAVEGTPAPAPTEPSPPTDDEATEPVGPVQPAGTPAALATGLQAPWSMARLDSGSTLVSERDTAMIVEVAADGATRDVGTVEGVAPQGEGGLLGIAVLGDPAGAVENADPDAAGTDPDAANADADGTGVADAAPGGPFLYAYFTSADDNRVVRMPLEGDPGSYTFGAAETVLTGIPKAGNHNGGRIAFGPDGALYVTAGDASNEDSAQDPSALSGKILRMNPDGSVPDDNPIAGSLTYSYGHRNSQGIAWDDDGQLWAAEFGQNTWDELNVIEAGGNYGWPIVEGQGTADGMINPVYQWPTSDASPSGLAIVRDTIFMAGLGGERLWVIQTGTAGAEGEFVDGELTAVGYFVEEFGRIRDVTAGRDGSVWMLTNNTDGRGSPREGDDKLIQVDLTPLAGS